MGRAARSSAPAVSGMALILGTCLFTDCSGDPVFFMAPVGFDQAAALLWDSTARRRDEFQHETSCFQRFHINLWDRKRQKHNEKRPRAFNDSNTAPHPGLRPPLQRRGTFKIPSTGRVPERRLPAQRASSSERVGFSTYCETVSQSLNALAGINL